MKYRRATFAGILLVLFAFMPCGAHAAVRSLSLGSSGVDVTALQNTLITKGYLGAGNNSGYFGVLTQAAVKKFQCASQILCSGTAVSGYGVAGPRTQAALGITGSASAPSPSKAFEISGWLPYWKKASSTVDVMPHLSELTSVMPFGYSMKTNGTLADTAQLSEEPWTSLIAAARAEHVRIIPTVMWGSGPTIHAILSNTTTRIALEDEIAQTVKDNNWDGVDIDFEAKQHETVDYFSTFLKGLYSRMGTKWVYCTVESRMPLEDRYLPGDVIPPDAQDFANDYVQMAKYCDRIEIMAYDQATVNKRLDKARQAPYAPVADPAWVENIVNLAAQQIPKNKIILGIPTYGYEYTVTPTVTGSYQYKQLWAFNPRYATDIASKLGITPTRTSANEIGFTYDAKVLEPAPAADTTIVQTAGEATTTVAQNSGNAVNTSQPFNYMTWSDAAGIADKVALAHRLGLRGVALFKFDGGEDPATWGVLK